MNPSYLCGFCQSPLKTFDSQGTPSIEITVRGNEEEEKKCPFFVKSSLLKDYWIVAVPREKHLQGKPAILSTRQHFHALPQQIQEKLQLSFLQMRQQG